MLPPLGPTLKEKDATKWIASLSEHLAPGESVRALARFSTMRPLTDAIAVTDRRVIAFFSASVNKKGPLVEISSADIGQADAHTKFGGRTLTVHAPGQQSRHIGTMRADDVSFVVGQVNAIAAAREPEAPTVDVYDPFSKPWEAPAPVDVPRPQLAAPPANVDPFPEPVLAEQIASESIHGVVGASKEETKRLVPRWKSVPLLSVAGFFGLLAVTGAFDRESGPMIFLFFAAFTLVPVSVLCSIRHRATRRQAMAAGSAPVYGLFSRNWVPIGIPLAVVLFIVSVAIS
ncbi:MULTISPECIES: hypothetical protein [Nocardiaceae]|uniref:hypothetical protein n=1 Tax=Nocardiaceae TaxID=85025 RepID=UPI0012D322CB|nr:MULTISPECIES: hypothetical protein [Rhodococcus]